MTGLVPNRLLFDFEFPLRYRAQTPILTGRLADWTDDYRLPDLSPLDGQTAFGSMWACWNERGIAIACRVTGRRTPLSCDPARFWRGDNLRLCTDMRDTRGVKRATRYCQQFYFLPIGAGRDGKAPAAASAPIQRAGQPAPAVPPSRIKIAARVLKSSYALEAHIPADALSGFDPAEHRRIGFYYMLEDTGLGQQYLTVGDPLYWYVDPSTWATAVLTD